MHDCKRCMLVYENEQPPCDTKCIPTKLMPENSIAYDVFVINRWQLIPKTVKTLSGDIKEKAFDVKSSAVWDTINGFGIANKKELFLKVLNTFRTLIKEDHI